MKAYIAILALAGFGVFHGLGSLASTVQSEAREAADFGAYMVQRMDQCQETRYTFECLQDRKAWIAEYRSR